MAAVSAREVTVSITRDPADATELAAVAAVTFPLACPPSSAPADIAAFIDSTLSAQRFADYLAADDREVLIARDDSTAIVGYSLVVYARPRDPDVLSVVTEPATEISKMYVLPDRHGGGVSAALMAAALDLAAGHGSALAWLGVNQENVRAQRFYRKMGFDIAGTKTFRVGNRTEHDYVMTRRLL
ncbi:GNAT family N-acetyltransferase [Gordonia jinhuaensis]|uniref:N-acetyltransferase n=2 Tax=Gordonia jinhuaensis TaxID=1517702 RepID=A0A916T0X1_9ACTN|nr:GNAT family N-acetyltransferase [Gordonia jinhuaensis]GGB25501.1 N-acetyltransferase [Gordonia jinhuaensis]